MIAACNGNEELVDLCLKSKASVSFKTSQKRETALYLACRNAREAIVPKLLQHGASLLDKSVTGATPLHAACLGGSVTVVSLLLERGSDVNETQLDLCTPLHLAAIRGNVDVAKELLRNGANVTLKNKFGKTPLHEACCYGFYEVVVELVKGGSPINAKDGDGLTPLHTAAAVHKEEKEEDYLNILKFFLSEGCDPNSLDEGHCTALHVAASAGQRGIGTVKELLKADVDITIESRQGWTALHSAHSQYGHPETVQLITRYAEQKYPDFLKTFDPKKPKNINKSKTESFEVTVSDRMPTEEEWEVLRGDHTLLGIAERIASGRSSNIIVLTGAGISGLSLCEIVPMYQKDQQLILLVSAGVPDFRSPEGMYSKTFTEKYSLPSPSAAFDPTFLRENPKPFFSICKHLFLPVHNHTIKYSFPCSLTTRPTPSHYFIKLLEQKGLLLRNYTQNIDMLELKAGIPEEKLVEAHGTFNRSFCIQCNRPGDQDSFWREIEQDGIPRCECGGIIRPDVVFFGEALPSRFLDLRTEDFSKCDLLIVMGTSLVVYPFAGLLNDVPSKCPRLLFNKDLVGPFTKVNSSGNYRDVAVIGDCDKGVLELISKLHWEEEFQQLLQNEK